MLPSAERTGWE